MFEVGDTVANKFGHVMAVGRVEELEGEESSTRLWCFYECNPEFGHWFKPTDIRLLSKTRGVAMEPTSLSKFAEQIKKRIEWARNVKGLPKGFNSDLKREKRKLTEEEKEEKKLGTKAKKMPKEKQKALLELLDKL